MVYLPGISDDSQNSVIPEERSSTNIKLDINLKRERERGKAYPLLKKNSIIC